MYPEPLVQGDKGDGSHKAGRIASIPRSHEGSNYG